MTTKSKLGEGKRVLVVEPHPDDGIIQAGGTLAQMIGNGAQVYFVTVNDGERGFMDRSFKDVKANRITARSEGRRATKLLGAKEDIFLGYDNHATTFELENRLKGRIMEQIRRTKPNIVMTYDPYARYEPNVDHRVTAFATYDAATFSQHHLDFPEQIEKKGLEPHIVDETWFFNSPEPNLVVDITGNVSKKLSCLLEYRSPMKEMLDEVHMRLKSAGLTSPLLKEPIEQQIMKFWLSGELEGKRYLEKFKVIKPFISERVPHLISLGLIQPDTSR